MAKKAQLLVWSLALIGSLFIVKVQAQETATTTAQTISAEKLRLIRELIELASSKKTIDAMLKAQAEELERRMPEMIWQAVSNMKELQSLTAKEREEMKSQIAASSIREGRRMYALLMEKIDFNKLIEDVSVPLHDKYFTENELRDLIAFYKSPTGAKVIEVMPNLITESISKSIEVLAPRIGDIIRQISEEETELAKKQIQATAKTKERPAKPVRTPRRRSSQ